ncbi:hypothetical protein ACS0TY_006017 [Phlomoides rotata]
MVWVMGIGFGLMNIAIDATPTRKLHWLSSIFVGMLMCKISCFIFHCSTMVVV